MTGRIVTVAALLVAAVSAWIVQRRRGVFLLGSEGPALGPACLLLLWLVAISLGEFSRSLAGMALCGAIPLAVLAGLSLRYYRPRPRVPSFTWIDLAAWLHIALVVGIIDRYDLRWHKALMGTYLRDNIPPTALNNPEFPLAYHLVYDAAVALCVRALRIDAEAGLDIVTAVCVGVTILCLGPVSRRLFRKPALAQASRLLFLYGFGPIFLRLWLPHDSYEVLHGQTAQSYVDVLLRRPTALGFVLYTLTLALLLPLYDGREPPSYDGDGREARQSGGPAGQRKPAQNTERHSGGTKRWGGGRAVALLAVAFLLPQIAEEVTLYAVLLGLPVLLRGRLGWRWSLATSFALLAGAVRSGVLWGILGRASMAAPGFHLVWPPALPSWNHKESGMGLLSEDGIRFFVIELGPVFIATVLLIAARGTWQRRLLLAPFLVGLTIATFGGLSVWPKADLDRFLFYGTPLVFMMAPSFVELVCGEYPLRPGLRRASSWLTFGLTAFVIASPAAFPVWLAWHVPRGPISWAEPNEKLRRHLAAVGPRESVLTTEDRVFDLLEAGFVVVAPVNGATYEKLDHEEFGRYVKAHAASARWLFVRSSDPRTEGRPVEGQLDDFVLVRTQSGDLQAR